MSKGPAGRGVRYEAFREDQGSERGGIIRLTGKYLEDHQEEILNLIKHEECLAMDRDPHTAVKISKTDEGFEVHLNSDNLAMRIGKAIVHAHQGQHAYKFRTGDKFVEVDWQRD